MKQSEKKRNNDWSLEDFETPKGKGVLKKTPILKKKRLKVRQGRIIVYMTKLEEADIRKQAEDLELSAAAFIRLQLKQNNIFKKK